MPDEIKNETPDLFTELAGLDAEAVAKKATPPIPESDVTTPDTPEIKEEDESEEDAETEEEAEGDASDDDGDAEEDSADDESEEEAPGAAAAEEDDAGLPAKNLASLQRRRKRQQEEHRANLAQVAQERAAIQAERAAFDELRGKDAEERKELDLLRARAKSSPRAAVLLLRKLGVAPSQFATVANIAFAMSDQADDKWKKEWAADDGTVGTEQEELRRKVEEMETWKKNQEQEFQRQRQAQHEEATISAYIDTVVAKAKAEKHPLMSAALKKNAQRAKHKLRSIAIYLAREKGATPSPGEVMEQAERLTREEAEMYGLSVTPQKPNPDAAKLKPAKTAKLATNGKPAKKIDLLAELEDMDKS